MDIRVLKISKKQPEQLEIRCHEVTESIREIVTFVKSRQGQLTGMVEGKLYELEAILKEMYFLRVSKSLCLNLMKVTAIRPALNGRFTAILQNGEEILISRKYVPDLKKALKGGTF